MAIVAIVMLTGAEVFCPSRVTELGWNMQLAFAGSPVHANVTVCFEPFCGVTVKVRGGVL